MIAMSNVQELWARSESADVYRAYINKMKKKTKEMNEKAPDTADAMKRYKAVKQASQILHISKQKA